ncbi:MAG: hypothetical protein IT452_05715 [Planctomycetia bacterium]|nr:hypothetical protein [Planctomycetia bacterium]
MDRRTRLPSDLAWILLWCAVTAAAFLFLGYHAKATARVVLLSLGGVLLLLTGALYRLHNWARWATAGLFALMALFRLLVMLRSGFKGSSAAMALAMAWWAWYLLSPSTKKLFQESGGVRLDRTSAIVFGGTIVVTIGGAIGLAMLGVPAWGAIGVIVAGVVAYVFVEERVRRRINAWFAPRPADLDREAWRTFREARRARAAGDGAGAEGLAAKLPASRSADLFRQVLAMDAARREGTLRRLVFDASYTPGVVARAVVARETQSGDPLGLVDERTRLIDALFEDESQDRPAMAEELEPLMERLSDQVFSRNADLQFRTWWEAARPRCTGGRQAAWLVSRLLEAQCHEAALLVARRSDDALLIEFAALARVLEDAREAKVGPGWFLSHADAISLHPEISDLFGLLYIDQPNVALRGHAWAAGRARMRIALVRFVRRFMDDYAENSWIEPPYLLAALTGARQRVFRAGPRFDAFWAASGPAQERHDAAMAEGFEAAGREEWEAAEVAFGRAVEAWPGRSTAEYNRAMALVELDRAKEAEELFLRRAAAEPKEPLFWVRIGDCRRNEGRVDAAVEAYEKAKALGGPAEALTARIAMTLAREQRDDQAGAALDKVLGPNPDAAELEGAAAALESEGAWKLAMKYQERAFYESLGTKSDDGDDEDGEMAGA